MMMYCDMQNTVFAWRRRILKLRVGCNESNLVVNLPGGLSRPFLLLDQPLNSGIRLQVLINGIVHS